MTSSAESLELPEGCPPEGHQPANGRFFRLTNPKHAVGDTTTDRDWRLPLHTPKGQGYQRYDLCAAYAISLFRDLEVLLRAREAVAFARKKSIAEIELAPDMGRTLETESFAETHHDWWPNDGVTPSGTVVESAVES